MFYISCGEETITYFWHDAASVLYWWYYLNGVIKDWHKVSESSRLRSAYLIHFAAYWRTYVIVGRSAFKLSPNSTVIYTCSDKKKKTSSVDTYVHPDHWLISTNLSW